MDMDGSLTNGQDSDVLPHPVNREDSFPRSIDDSPTHEGGEPGGLPELGSSEIRPGDGFRTVQDDRKLDRHLAILHDVSRSKGSGVRNWMEQWEDILYRYVSCDDSLTDGSDDIPTTDDGSESEGLPELGSSDIRTENGFETVHVNGKWDSHLVIVNDVSRSSDSGVHSWTEQWENMSDVSMIDSDDDAGGTMRGRAEEKSGLIFVAPPNSEVDSDSDDSSILGIRRVLRHRVPYRGRTPCPKKGFPPAPQTPPVQPRNHADRWQFECESTRAKWSRWQYGPPLDCKWPLFERFIRTLTEICLDHRHDIRHDRYYPRLVRSLVKAGRVVQTVPRSRENYRRRRDLMMRLFDEDMERQDVVLDRFPDRLIHRYLEWFPICDSFVPPREPETNTVMGTHTPPIRRKRYRKYAALRAFETDVDDYFGNSTEEWRWTARSASWYQP